MDGWELHKGFLCGDLLCPYVPNTTLCIPVYCTPTYYGMAFHSVYIFRLTCYRPARWSLHVYDYMFPTHFRPTVYNPTSYWSAFYRVVCQALRVIWPLIMFLHIKGLHVVAMHIMRPNIAFYSIAYFRPVMFKGYVLSISVLQDCIFFTFVTDIHAYLLNGAEPFLRS